MEIRNLKEKIDKKILEEFFTGTRACEWHKPIDEYWNAEDCWFDYVQREKFHRGLTYPVRDIIDLLSPFYKEVKMEWDKKHAPFWIFRRKWAQTKEFFNGHNRHKWSYRDDYN